MTREPIIGRRRGGEPADEAEHFYACKACGQAVDKRDLAQVFHHEERGHEPLPETIAGRVVDAARMLDRTLKKPR